MYKKILPFISIYGHINLFARLCLANRSRYTYTVGGIVSCIAQLGKPATQACWHAAGERRGRGGGERHFFCN